MNHTQSKALNQCLTEFISDKVAFFDFAATLTMKPINAARRESTKKIDAEQALSWFLHLLNTRCFGHSHRRKNIELGVFAALEGLGHNEQPHWHLAFRLPRFLTHKRFLVAFEIARKRTRRLGYAYDLQPFYDGWIEYSLKTGAANFQPQFLRAGTR